MAASKFQFVAVAALAFSTTAYAAPYANVASVTQVGRPLTIAGGGFEPGALVNLRVLGPGNAVTMAAVVAGADGSISHTLVTTNDGTYVVQLSHPDGRAAVSAIKFHASR